MELITFDQLPTAVSRLYTKLENIERLLQLKSEPQQPIDRWLDIDEFCQYHPGKPAKPTVYGWVAAGLVPNHKSSKKLRFLQSEIDQWLKSGRRKTRSEIQAETNTYLESKKKGGTR